MEAFREPFMRYALVAGFLCGGLCAFLGVYVILKRVAFMAIALSQLAALGVALGLMLGIHADAFALLLTLAGVILLWVPLREQSISKESIIGLTYCVAAALSIILIALNPRAEASGLDLISGNLLYATAQDLLVLAILCVVVLGIHLALFRGFLFVSFDKDMAHASGMRADFYDFMLYASVGLAIALAMKVSGILFVFASLVVPPMAGLMLFRKMKTIFAVSCAVAVLMVPVGLALSYRLDVPSGPAIVCCYCAVFLLVALFSRLVRSR